MKTSTDRVRPITTTKEISLREIVAPIFRRRKAMIATFLVVFVLVIAAALLLGPSYTSKMAILVNRERLDPLVSTEATTQMIANNTAVQPEEVNSEVELLTSRDVLEEVAKRNGMDKPSDGFSLDKILHPNRTEQDRLAIAVKKLAKEIKTSVTTKSNVIEVTYTSPNAQRSYGVLKALGELYTAKHVEVHRPAGSYEFFAKQTQKYQDDLESAEAKLREFGKANGVSAPDVQRTNLALQVADSVGLQHLAEQTIAADEERIRQDERQMKATPERTSTLQSSSTADRLLESLKESLLTAENRRTGLALKYDPEYPAMKEVDQEIATIKASIAEAENTRYSSQTTDRDPTYELLREDEAKTASDLAGQRASLIATRRSIQSIQDQMVNLDQQSIAERDLLRQVKADEDNYLLYLSKREQERTTDALDNTRIANVAIAVPPGIPVLPTVGLTQFVMLAFFLGLIASICMAYLLDQLDSSFHTPAQVVDILGIPVVVTVPKKTA